MVKPGTSFHVKGYSLIREKYICLYFSLIVDLLIKAETFNQMMGEAFMTAFLSE